MDDSQHRHRQTGEHPQAGARSSAAATEQHRHQPTDRRGQGSYAFVQRQGDGTEWVRDAITRSYR